MVNLVLQEAVQVRVDNEKIPQINSEVFFLFNMNRFSHHCL